jgi:hypothetical protein
MLEASVSRREYCQRTISTAPAHAMRTAAPRFSHAALEMSMPLPPPSNAAAATYAARTAHRMDITNWARLRVTVARAMAGAISTMVTANCIQSSPGRPASGW